MKRSHLGKVLFLITLWATAHLVKSQVSSEDLAALLSDPAGNQLIDFKNRTRVNYN